MIEIFISHTEVHRGEKENKTMDLELLVLLPFKYISLLESLVIIFPLILVRFLGFHNVLHVSLP